MKRPVFVLLIGCLALSLAGVTGVANAGNNSACGTGSTAPDPFGSCEVSAPAGSVRTRCGTGGVDVPAVGTFLTPQSGSGIQACAGPSSSLPIRGRVGIYVSPSNAVTLFIDGDDSFNQGGAQGWQRYDVAPTAGSCRVHVRRDGAGSYWNSNPTHNPPTINLCLA